MSKISYAIYIKDRISGFAGDGPRTQHADLEAFPSSSSSRRAAEGRPSPAPFNGWSGGAPHTRRSETTSLICSMPSSTTLPPDASRSRPPPEAIALFQTNDFYPRGTHPWRLWPRPCGRSTMRSSPPPPPMCYVS